MIGVIQSGYLRQQGHLLCGIVNTHVRCFFGTSQVLSSDLKNETKRLT